MMRSAFTISRVWQPAATGRFCKHGFRVFSTSKGPTSFSGFGITQTPADKNTLNTPFSHQLQASADLHTTRSTSSTAATTSVPPVVNTPFNANLEHVLQNANHAVPSVVENVPSVVPASEPGANVVPETDSSPAPSKKYWGHPKFDDESELHFMDYTPFHYQDAGFYKEEQQKIFNRNWLPSAWTSELKHNRVLCRRIYNREVLIVRTKQDEVKAFYNACRHRGARVAKRDGNQKALICPYHAWKYNLDGKLIKTPRFEQPDFDKEKFGLQEIRCKTLRNMVMLNFTPLDEVGLVDETQIPLVDTPLEDVFGGLCDDLAPYPMEDLEVVKTKKYYVDSNWKALIDNFQEYYHLPSVHPALVQVSGMNDHICTQQDYGKYIGFKTEPLTCAGQPIDADEKLLPFMPGIKGTPAATRATFNVIYPNMFWFLLPNHLFTVLVEPVSANKSIEHATLLIHKDSAHEEKYQEQIQKIWDFYDMVNDEDLKVCEEMQKGICQEGVSQERVYVKPYEKTIQRFHHFLMDDMARE
jgi:phenylpropionate dioxygenase-like ring-hydroxylating dioxygenase large terminal subunit